jgi:hypothetical protein
LELNIEPGNFEIIKIIKIKFSFQKLATRKKIPKKNLKNHPTLTS